MSDVRIIKVAENDAGMRLDRWFREHVPTLTHGQLQKLLRTGQIRVDGGRVKAGARLETGQAVRIPPLPDNKRQRDELPRPKPRLSREDEFLLPSRVLYRDDDLIVIDKPARLATQGGSGTQRHIDGLLDTLQFDAPERPRLVHRLDKDTSGLLLLARNRRSAQQLTKAFRTRDVQKLYWAICVGAPKPASGKIDAPLAKRRAGGAGSEKMMVDEMRGERALTLYHTLAKTSKTASWLALAPLTGRTHQLRAHLAAIGTPVLGDGKYGGAAAFLEINGNKPALHLHACGLRLDYGGGKPLIFSAPLPAEMRKTWDALGFDEDMPEAREFLAES